MISVAIDAYAVKKHFFTIFVCLMLGIIAFLYMQGERIFSSVIGAQHTALEPMHTYQNAQFGFSVAYPAEYLVGEKHDLNGGTTVYVTPEQDPPFLLETAPNIRVEEGDWRDVVARAERQKGGAAPSVRTVTVGDSVFAKEITYGANAGGKRLKEVVFGRLGMTYDILQYYTDAVDPAYPLLVKTFQFQ